jgi:hypothetical protein
MKFPEIPNRRFFLTALCLVFLVGAFLRLPMSVFRVRIAGTTQRASSRGWISENWVRRSAVRACVDDLIRYGVSSYPDLAERYVEYTPSADGNSAAYTFSLRLRGIPVAWNFWHRRSWLASLRFESVQHIAPVLTAGFAGRLGGWRIGLCVMALMVCAPTQIHMAQHALIDGFFAFWATASLWLLWENLRRPNYAPLLALYGLSLTLLVLTKENAMLFTSVFLLR